MTVRKSSSGPDISPYQNVTNPLGSKPPAAPNQPQHLDVDSADIPPLPSSANRSPVQSPNAYGVPRHPWLDELTGGEGITNTWASATQQSTQSRALYEDGTNHTGLVEARTQHTPRSSMGSTDDHNVWAQDAASLRFLSATTGQANPGVNSSEDSPANGLRVDVSDSHHAEANAIRRKPVASAFLNYQIPALPQTEDRFASNNPFRRRISTDQVQARAEPIPIAWNDRNLNVVEPSNHIDGDAAVLPLPDLRVSSPDDLNQKIPTMPSSPPPLPSAPTRSISAHEQPPLIAVTYEDDGPPKLQGSNQVSSGVASPIPSSDPPVATYTNSLLSKQHDAGVVSLNDARQSVPNAVEIREPHDVDLIDFDDSSVSSRSQATHNLEDQPPVQPPRPTKGSLYALPERLPPTKPPRPAPVVTAIDSDAQLARMTEQRNETYQIKHFNWFDQQSGKMRRSSMLIQNRNGPCPLLALVNALILGIREDSQAALDDALRAREQVTLGLIIETLIDELLSTNNQALPDVDELNRFLTMLATGMNANPKFVNPSTSAPNLIDARDSILQAPSSQPPVQAPGSFELTKDIKLYGSFSIPLIHGWLPPKRDPAWKAFSRSAQSYEDAQVVQFGEEELEYKLSNGGLADEEQQIWQDIVAIKDFLRLYPTQLTPYGLETIQAWLLPGQFAILFRNDHFSTIYKHPQSGALFTLITDAGYADRDEIIWESLSDHKGHGDFFSGDFRNVSHSDGPAKGRISDPSGPRRSSQYPNASGDAAPLSPQERQEQHDADFAMALQLQEEEEQRANNNRRRPGGGRRSESNIPIPIRPRPQQEARPSIPPRNSRSQTVAVNRSAELEGEDAPPAYEEAAKDKPYNPPLGSPLHPTSEPSPRTSATHLVPAISATSSTGPPHDLASAAPAPAPVLRRPQRRTSAYGENHTRYGGFPSGPSSPSISQPVGHAYGAPSGFDGDRYAPGRLRRGHSGLDRDCVVM